MHDGHQFSIAVNNAKPVELPVPYTKGMWQQTQPVELTLNQGQNSLQFEILGGGRLAIKDFTLTPVR